MNQGMLKLDSSTVEPEKIRKGGAQSVQISDDHPEGTFGNLRIAVQAPESSIFEYL